MAVYTDVSDEDLSDFVASYGLGKLLSFRGIAEGVENTNYIVHTEKGAFILTLYEKRVRQEDLPFFLGLTEFLAQNGVTCPLPVRDLKGQSLRVLSGRPAALISFLEGIWLRRPQLKHCEKLGATLAEFHKAGQTFAMSRKNSLSLPDWRPLFEKIGADADQFQKGLSHMILSELDFLEDYWPSPLPMGIIHADLFPDNVFFIGDEISGLIDFYFACTDMLAYDLAICLNAWCFEPDLSFNITKARGLIKNYHHKRPLKEEELNALPLLARGAALRFLLTRLYDWIHTAKDALVARKDPNEYIRKLQFHQQIRNIREYGVDL